MANRIKKYIWPEIQAAYNSGLTYSDLYKKFGVVKQSLINAKKRGDFISRTRSQSGVLSHQRNPRVHTKETKQKLREHMLRRLANGSYPTLGKNFKGRPQSYPEKWFESVINARFVNKEYITEHSIGLYSLDFAWVKLKKCIEIDGATHETTREKDHRRDTWLRAQGWEILRIEWKSCVRDKETYIQLANDFINNPL